MKILKKAFLALLMGIIIGVATPKNAEALSPPTYPMWGYNPQSHLCERILEHTEERLVGSYKNIRECRSGNFQTIFYTGQGILIWFGIFLMTFLFHYLIFPKLKKRSSTEKMLYHLQDIIFIGLAVFFIVLIGHYFYVPYGLYSYDSDIDRIIYSLLISPFVALKVGILYILISLSRAYSAYKSSKISG